MQRVDTEYTRQSTSQQDEHWVQEEHHQLPATGDTPQIDESLEEVAANRWCFAECEQERHDQRPGATQEEYG